MSIRLNKYLGQEVQIELLNGEGYVGVVSQFINKGEFRFQIGNAPNLYNLLGHYSTNLGFEPYDIVSIKPFTKTMKLTGLAQKHPNIDLTKFNGKTVFIRLNKEYCALRTRFIGKVNCYITTDVVDISGYCFTTSGNRTNYPKEQWITEIYEEGAFAIETMPIPDVDQEVEKAKEAVKNLSEEQIAQLLHSLKK